MKITVPPEHIAAILNRLDSAGHEAYLIGGCVRDAVMCRPIHDWDLATSATPVDVARLFPKTVLTGEKFGTVTIVLPECPVEVTTFRTEGEYLDGRRPHHVDFVSNLHEDLSRRDFTINAMAESVDGELIDPYCGVDDIETGIIRCVGGPNTRFTEDALRMLRALRFSAVLGFTIEPETLHAIYANAGLAARLSAERVRAELEKILTSERPEIVGEMIKIGLLDRYMIVSGKSPDGLERIAELPAESTLRWCVFCAILLEKNYIPSASKLLHDMRLDSKMIKTCNRAIEIHTFPDDRIGVKQLISKTDISVARCAAAIAGVHALQSIEDILASGECATLNELDISGRDLMERGHLPGPKLGETLNKLLEHVIENPEENVRDTLLGLVDSYII